MHVYTLCSCLSGGETPLEDWIAEIASSSKHLAVTCTVSGMCLRSKRGSEMCFLINMILSCIGAVCTSISFVPVPVAVKHSQKAGEQKS